MKKKTQMTVWCLTIVILTAGYVAAEVVGWEPTALSTKKISPNVRKSPGGWRTWTYWNRSLRGGK